jgi:hypothetical protein
VRMTARTFMAAFPHTTLWFSPLRSLGLLVGTRDRLQIDFQALSGKLRRPGVREQLERVGVEDPLDVLAWFVTGDEGLSRYVGDASLNTDNHPYLEFTPAWSYFFATRYGAQNLYAFGLARKSVFPWLVNTGDSASTAALAERVARRYEATQHSISGDLYTYLGMADKARQEYATALAIDPDDKNAASVYWKGRLK